ncbi:MAG: hypothetical protein IJ622_05765 [Bacteroidales bacterium]|nr:hypothetical protein [Bacteroidales bacterium]
MTDNYDDIINLPHHVSKSHAQMSMMNRAAQFAPFAALTGHSAAIEETARLTDEQQELAEEDSDALNQKMAYLREVINEHPTITITYFEPDKKKAGGKYKSIEGQLQNIDDYGQAIILKSGVSIPFVSILDIQIQL